MTSSFTINSTQLNLIDSHRLSDGINQYMDCENYSYIEAAKVVLQNEGWELRKVNGLEHYLEFHNKNTGQVANAVKYKNMLVPVTNDPCVTNAFNIQTNGIHSWIQPNEWHSTSTYDTRRGRRLMKRNLWRQKIKENNQRINMDMSKETIY